MINQKLLVEVTEMNNNEQAIQEARKHIQSVEKGIKFLSLLPGCNNISLSGETVHIRLPFSISELRNYRCRMGKNWKQLSTQVTNYSSGDIGHSSVFTHKEMGGTIFITRDTSYGGICHREQVGEKTVPVYKVVCDD